jgi:hypothetical protein
MFNNIAYNFKKIMELSFFFVFRINCAIKSNSVKLGVSLKILKQLFEVNSLMYCLLREVNI